MHGLRVSVLALAGVVALALAAVVVPAGVMRAALASGIAEPSGAIGVRLVADQQAATDGPLGRVYIVDHLAPGTSIRRQIVVSNSTRSIADVAVYAAGASFGHRGFAFAPGRVQDQLSGWTSISRPVVRLLPGAAARETVTIKVPRDASSGQDYGLIWAQVSAPSAAGGVTLVNRVGVRMYVSIGTGGAPRANFTIGSLVAGRSADRSPSVSATVHNDGAGALEFTGSLRLSDGPGGVRDGPFPVVMRQLVAPGASALVTVAASARTPDGPWRAVLLLASEGITRSAAATLRFPGPPSAPPAKSHILGLVLAALLVLLASAALVSLSFLKNRSRGARGRLVRPRSADVPAQGTISRTTREETPCPKCLLQVNYGLWGEEAPRKGVLTTGGMRV